ncbi:hypothetical protein LXL04_038584 [Taraxacum kok-saghyz]
MDVAVLGSFENSYIPENLRTPPISYISETVIPFKKPTSGLSKTFLKLGYFDTGSKPYSSQSLTPGRDPNANKDFS